MTIPLLFLLAIVALVVWWLLRPTLNARPWVAQSVGSVEPDRAFLLPPAKVGLWVFLGVATSLFALLISAYSMRMTMGGDWDHLAVPRVLWLNTGALVASSAAMERARTAARRAQIEGVRSGLLAGGVFAFSFLAGQLWAWQQLNAAGYFAAANPANAFFYLLTALHGLHLLGGLWVWRRTIARVWRRADVGDGRLSVELCTVYWHYLLLLWLVLFALLSYPSYFSFHG
jgi:cytochrome c oxidase subunit 3